MKKPSLKLSSLNPWSEERKKKKKEKQEQERLAQSSSLKILAFVLTLVAMALGMSLLPLFPQPLPILIAVLVAFVTYQSPKFGMPIGGAVIGLGLMYHLSLPPLYFISFLGALQTRVAVVVIWMTLFIVLPLVFSSYKSAVAIDLGILAVASLFFNSTYFLAIPLIVASAVFFKKNVGLTIVYYVLLSVPLQIVQYWEFTVKPIVRSDWWLAPGSAPPVFVSLSQILPDLNTAMSQFRLYDASQAVYAITGQLTWQPNFTGRSLSDAMVQYRDSVPGMLMFVVIVVGLALALIFFARLFVREGVIGVGNKLFPVFMATITVALFYVFLGALQLPLAFTADVSPADMVLAPLATLLFTLPVVFVDFTPKQTATSLEIVEKARALLGRLQVFEGQLDNVKENIPVVVSSPEGKMVVIKDDLQDIIMKSEGHFYEPYELDQKFLELKKIGGNIDDIESELATILLEYQTLANCEFSDWIGKFKESGLDVKSTVSADFKAEMSLDERIEAIKKVLDGGRGLAKDVIKVAEPVYDIIRSLYDPTLPEKSRAIEFALQKLEQKDSPWIAVEALFTSLNNWKRQYGAEIQASLKYLQSSFEPIISLGGPNESLPPIFGDKMPKVLEYAKKAEVMKTATEKAAAMEELNIIDVIALKDEIQSFLGMTNDVLSILNTALISEEQAIERLLPTTDFLWDKNSSLQESLNKVTETLANPSSYKINQIMENLPHYLSYVDESVQTLAIYNERKEFLLNYPTAEAAIQEQLKKKNKLSPKDLPFQPKFASEYLRLYYIKRFSEFSFDTQDQVLTKKA